MLAKHGNAEFDATQLLSNGEQLLSNGEQLLSNGVLSWLQHPCAVDECGQPLTGGERINNPKGRKPRLQGNEAFLHAVAHEVV